MRKERTVVLSITGKILSILAREVVPFVLSVLVRSALKALKKKDKPESPTVTKEQDDK